MMLMESRTQQVSALGQHVGVSLTQTVEQVRGPFDVGEEEGDHSGRELTHAAPPDKGCTTHPR